MTGFFIDHLWLVPVLPLFGALAILVLGRRLGEPKAGWLASLMTIGSFLITVAVFFNLLSRPAEERHQVVTMFKWIPVGSLILLLTRSHHLFEQKHTPCHFCLVL